MMPSDQHWRLLLLMSNLSSCNKQSLLYSASSWFYVQSEDWKVTIDVSTVSNTVRQLYLFFLCLGHAFVHSLWDWIIKCKEIYDLQRWWQLIEELLKLRSSSISSAVVCHLYCGVFMHSWLWICEAHKSNTSLSLIDYESFSSCRRSLAFSVTWSSS